MKHLITFIFLLVVLPGLRAQDFNEYERGSYIKGKDSIYYRILFPENFDASKKYPVLFFLHGRGESGSDNEKQLTHGGKLFLKPDVRKEFPAIVVFPQCPATDYWANVKITSDQNGKRHFDFRRGGKPTKAMHALVGMVDNFLDKPFVDQERVYVAGLSMGGMGTYELLRRKRDTFASAFAICGGDHVGNVRKYQHVPLWIFHGEKDDIVLPGYSIAIANQLKIHGKEVKLTLYPNANHNSWDATFAEPGLLKWLFSHTRTK